MQPFDQRGTSPQAGTATATAAPDGRGRPPQWRDARRALALSVLAAVALGLLVEALLFSGVGGALSALGWFQPSSSPPRGFQPTVGHATATPSPVPRATTNSGLSSSPQGCALGSVAPRPPSFRIYSARGYPGARGEVALTFDDGPSPIYTRQILDELQAAGAHATFFDVGAHARRYPDLVRAELRGGNAVGNHTYTHQDLAGQSLGDIRWQLTTTTTTLQSITQDRCLWLFRPPYGAFDANVLAEAHREGFTTVIWDVWALDWLRPGTAVIAQRIISQLHSGAIILLHDGAPETFTPDRSQTANAMPAILAAIRVRGLRAVTLPQMLRDAGLIQDPGTSSASTGRPISAPTPSLPPGSEGMLAPPVAEVINGNTRPTSLA
jgi:peptidoglycan/xylan/chitin deacetylase (PgdA/CDA1 family)